MNVGDPKTISVSQSSRRSLANLTQLVLLAGCWLSLQMAAPASVLADETLPNVKVTSIKRLFDNGEHNAFTDLCRFQGKIYLAFRSCPQGHMVHPTSRIVILSSEDDGQTWQQVYQFSVSKRDTRDPHFLVFQKKLFVYTGTWYCGESSPTSRDMNQHLGFAVWSSDGKKWSAPTMLEGTYGHYIWRAATVGDKAYLCGRRKNLFAEVANRSERDPIVESVMLESDDGLVWKKSAFFQTQWGDETAFLFEPDGAVLAVARCGSSRPGQVCRSLPPYQEWQRTDLDRYIGGPLVAKWNGQYLVGGRKMLPGKPAVTTLYWLIHDELVEFAELPSGGDNSYPGFVSLSENRALVSYYSSHEKDDDGKTITAIYLAELKMEK